MIRRLVVVGAGGFGRETVDVVEAINGLEPSFDLLGVLDDSPSDLNLQRLRDRNVDYLGSLAEWLPLGRQAEYVVAIGSPSIRRRISEHLDSAGFHAASLIHPHAIIGSRVTLAKGSIVCGGVHISTNCSIGAHVHLNPNCTVGHDAVIGDYVSVNPGAVISGEVNVFPDALVGAGAVVLQGLEVGEGAVIGASACVVKNVATAAIVKGVPAR
ncbi:MAG: sugar acetyltransferase [Microbacteriaceae bacterium]|nr:sugar acetyltransferase [Microbacteriaceae bacterium]